MNDNNVYIMHKDIPVIKFNIDTGICCIMNEEFVPYSLKNSIKTEENLDSVEKILSIRSNNRDKIIEYLANRMLVLSRKNVKKILTAYNFSQNQSPYTKARIAIVCKAVSMTDCYWIKTENDKLKWKDINPRKNHLNEIVSHIALCGKSLTLDGTPRSPELTLQGAYAKCWKRPNGETFLLKRSSSSKHESDIEVMGSDILDCFNVPHVHYDLTKISIDGETFSACMCKNMASENLSLVDAGEFYSYCARNDKDFIQEVLKIDSEMIYKMCIIDYLLQNPDRHLGNWGFYRNNDTGEIVRMHPLFDHNNAFDETMSEEFKNRIFSHQTMFEAAKYSLKKCDFRCIKPLEKRIFLTDNMYYQFMDRMCKVGICEKERTNFISRMVNGGAQYKYLYDIQEDNSEHYYKTIQYKDKVKKKDISFER